MRRAGRDPPPPAASGPPRAVHLLPARQAAGGVAGRGWASRPARGGRRALGRWGGNRRLPSRCRAELVGERPGPAGVCCRGVLPGLNPS